MTPDKPVSSSNPLEQFVLLAKSAKGAAAIELIKQVLEAPGVHVFGELLDMPNLIEVILKSIFLFVISHCPGRSSGTGKCMHLASLQLNWRNN